MSSKISASKGARKKKKATSTNSNDKSLSSEEVISLVDASSSEEEDNGYGSDLQIIEPKHSRGGSTKGRKQHSTKKSTTTKRNENSTKCLKNPPSPPKPRSNRRARDIDQGKSGWGNKGMGGFSGWGSPQNMAARGGRSKNSNNRSAISTSSTQSSRMGAWSMGRGKGRSGAGRKGTGTGRVLGGMGMDGGDNKHDRREMFLRSLDARRLGEDNDLARNIKRQRKTGAADMDVEHITAATSGASGTGGFVNLADDDSVPSIEGDKKPSSVQLGSGKQQGHTNDVILELDNSSGPVAIDLKSMTAVGISEVGDKAQGNTSEGMIDMMKLIRATKRAVNASGLDKSTPQRRYLHTTAAKTYKKHTDSPLTEKVKLYQASTADVSKAGTQAKLDKLFYGYLSFQHNEEELFKTSVGKCDTAVEAFDGLGVDVPSNNYNSMRQAAGLEPRRSNGECQVGKWNALDIVHVPGKKVPKKQLTWMDPPEESKALFISLLPLIMANNGQGGWAEPTLIHPPSSDGKSYTSFQQEMLQIIAPHLASALPHKPREANWEEDMALLRPAIAEGAVAFRARGDGNDHRQTARSVRGVGQGSIADGVFKPRLWKIPIGRHKVTPNVPGLVETVQQEARVLYDIYSYCQPESFSSATSLKDDKAAIIAHVRGLLAYR